MARFDDASRSLHRLERQLYQAEYGDEEDEDLEYDDEEEYDEYSDEEDEDYEEDYEEYDDEDDEYEEEADPRAYRRQPGRHSAFRRDGYDRFDEDAAMAPRQNRRVGKLLLLAMVEILAIIAIIRWWIQWL